MFFRADSLEKVPQRATNGGLFSKVEAPLLASVLTMTSSSTVVLCSFWRYHKWKSMQTFQLLINWQGSGKYSCKLAEVDCLWFWDCSDVVSFSPSLSEEAENWLLSVGGEWVYGYWNSPAIAPLTVLQICWTIMLTWNRQLITGYYR